MHNLFPVFGVVDWAFIRYVEVTTSCMLASNDATCIATPRTPATVWRYYRCPSKYATLLNTSSQVLSETYTPIFKSRFTLDHSFHSLRYL